MFAIAILEISSHEQASAAALSFKALSKPGMAATRSLHISPDPDVALRLARLQTMAWT